MPGLPKASEPVEVDAARIRLESNLGMGLDNGQSCFDRIPSSSFMDIVCGGKEGGCSAAHEESCPRELPANGLCPAFVGAALPAALFA